MISTAPQIQTFCHRRQLAWSGIITFGKSMLPVASLLLLMCPEMSSKRICSVIFHSSLQEAKWDWLACNSLHHCFDSLWRQMECLPFFTYWGFPDLHVFSKVVGSSKDISQFWWHPRCSQSGGLECTEISQGIPNSILTHCWSFSSLNHLSEGDLAGEHRQRRCWVPQLDLCLLPLVHLLRVGPHLFSFSLCKDMASGNNRVAHHLNKGLGF